jgi:acetyl esterase/lipase
LAVSTRAQDPSLFKDSRFDYNKTETNIPYSELYPRLRLDVYTPKNADNIPLFPSFIILHGLDGSKEIPEIVKLCQNWAKRGYVTVAINYDLNDANTAAEAVRWVRAKADDYKVDPSRIAIGGGSAGAYTAMSAAFQNSYQTHVSVVLDLWGPTGGIIPFVDRNDPPTFIVHGAADKKVPFKSNAIPLRNRLDQVGVDNVLKKIPRAGHSCFDDYWNYREDDKTIDQQCAEFFYTHLDLANL